jgi:hypothetical protein
MLATAESKSKLEKKQQQLQTRLIWREKLRNGLWLVGAPTCMMGGIVAYGLLRYYSANQNAIFLLFILAVVAVFICFIIPFALDIPHILFDLSEVQNQLDLLELAQASQEEKAQELFRIRQNELSRYLMLTLYQSRRIFLVGILALIFGFALVIFVIYTFELSGDVSNSAELAAASSGNVPKGVFSGSSQSVANNIETGVIALLGAVTAVLTSYVGTVYLKMFSEISRSVGNSAALLTNTNIFHFAHVVASEITNEQKRNEAFANLAMVVGSRMSPVPELSGKESKASPSGLGQVRKDSDNSDK